MKVKTLEDKPRSGWPLFFIRVRNVIEKAGACTFYTSPLRKCQKT